MSETDLQIHPPIDPQMDLREALGCALRSLADESLSPDERFDLAEFMISKLPQLDFPTFHHFADGQYIREVSHPAGSVLTSVIHRVRHPFFLLRGEIAVYWIEGDRVLRNVFTAPTYTITLPETRRFVIALRDTTAVAVYRTDETDPDRIMEEISIDRKNPLLDADFIPGWKRANAAHQESLCLI